MSGKVFIEELVSFHKNKGLASRNNILTKLHQYIDTKILVKQHLDIPNILTYVEAREG